MTRNKSNSRKQNEAPKLKSAVVKSQDLETLAGLKPGIVHSGSIHSRTHRLFHSYGELALAAFLIMVIGANLFAGMFSSGPSENLPIQASPAAFEPLIAIALGILVLVIGVLFLSNRHHKRFDNL